MIDTETTTIAFDGMGGDNAPGENVLGAILAISKSPNVNIKIYGDSALINKELSGQDYDKSRIEVIHSPEVIENSDSPTAAIKKKKNSSMVMGLLAVRNGEADAFVSLGSTGALLAGGLLLVGRIKGVERPALAFVVPTRSGQTMIIDCGANMDAKPKMLAQFAQMGSVYMEDVLGVKRPRVGIVNIGEEEEKGNTLVKETIPILKELKGINYIGCIESRAIPYGNADIAVCDAFVGNTLLKMYEGVAGALMAEIKDVMYASLKTKIGAAMIKNELKGLMKRFSSNSYGGSPLLGLKGLVVKTHGSSKAPAICNTLLDCETYKKERISEKIAERIAK